MLGRGDGALAEHALAKEPTRDTAARAGVLRAGEHARCCPGVEDVICSSSKPAPLAASPDVSFLIHTFAASFCSGPKVAAEATGRGGRGAVRSVLLVDRAGGAPRTAQLRRRLLNGGGAEDEFELLVLGRCAPNLYRGAERLNRLGKRLAAAALVVQLALLKESQLHLHQPGGARVAGRDRLLNPCLRLLALGDAEALGRERDLPAQDKEAMRGRHGWLAARGCAYFDAASNVFSSSVAATHCRCETRRPLLTIGTCTGVGSATSADAPAAKARHNASMAETDSFPNED